MKKFSRTNPQNKSMSTLTPMHINTENDNDDSVSDYSLKNDLALNKSDAKETVFGDAVSCIALVAPLKRNIKRNLYYAFAKLKQNATKYSLSKRKISTVFTLAGKLDLSVKKEAISRMKIFVQKEKQRIQGCLLADNCFRVITKRLKKQFFIASQRMKMQQMTSEISQLKEKAHKYQENYIHSEGIGELRKFQKLNTKAIKGYQKPAQQILKPALEQIAEGLQSRRRKKMIKSDSQIIIKIAMNQLDLLESSGYEAEQLKEDLRKIQAAHEQAKILNSKNGLQRNNIVKDLKKLDAELAQKNEGVFNNPSLKNVFKPFLKTIEAQKAQCSKKGEDNYIYGSRAILLEFIAGYATKFMEAISDSEATVSNPKMKKKVSVISEHTSVQESGIIEDVIRDLSRLINTYANDLGKSIKSATAHMNSDSLTEMMNVRTLIRDVEEIIKAQASEIETLEKELADEVKSLQKSEQQPVSKDDEKRAILERDVLQILQHKIKQLETYLNEAHASKEKQCEQLKLKFQKIKSGMDKELQSVTGKLAQKQKKLQKIQKTMKEQIQANDKLSEELNELKNKKQAADSIVAQAREEYKRFKTQFKAHSKEAKQREKSVKQLITPRSNKSKILSNFFSSPISQAGGIRHRAGSITSPKVSSRNKTMSIMNSNSIAAEDSDEQQKRETHIRELKQRIYELKEEIAEKNITIQILEKKDGMISVDNMVTLVYNVLVKTAKIPEQSSEAQEIWKELSQLKTITVDVDLLMGLEVFCVVWLERNVIDSLEQRVSDKNRELSELLINMNRFSREFAEATNLDEIGGRA